MSEDHQLLYAVRPPCLVSAMQPVIERYTAAAEVYGSEGSCVFEGSTLGPCCTFESEAFLRCVGADAVDVPRTVSGTAANAPRTEEQAVESGEVKATQTSMPTEDTEAATSPAVASQCAANRCAKAVEAPDAPVYSTEYEVISSPKLHCPVPDIPPCPLGLWRKKAPRTGPNNHFPRILGKKQWNGLFPGKSF